MNDDDQTLDHVAKDAPRHPQPGRSSEPAPLLFTITQAATLLGVGRSTAYELIATGELGRLHLDRRVAADESHLRLPVDRGRRAAEHPGRAGSQEQGQDQQRKGDELLHGAFLLVGTSRRFTRYDAGGGVEVPGYQPASSRIAWRSGRPAASMRSRTAPVS